MRILGIVPGMAGNRKAGGFVNSSKCDLIKVQRKIIVRSSRLFVVTYRYNPLELECSAHVIIPRD